MTTKGLKVFAIFFTAFTSLLVGAQPPQMKLLGDNVSRTSYRLLSKSGETYVSAGHYDGYASVITVDPVSGTGSAHGFPAGSFSCGAPDQNGGYVLGGYRGTGVINEFISYICRVDENLDTLWTRSVMSLPNTFWDSRVVDIVFADNGDVVAIIGANYPSRATLVRFSSNGEVLWCKGINVGSVYLLTIDDKTCVLSSEINASNGNKRDVFLRVFDGAGNEIDRRTYGSILHHDDIRGVEYKSDQNEIVMITRVTPSSSGGTGFLRIAYPSLEPSVTKLYPGMSSYGLLVDDGGDTFIAGWDNTSNSLVVWQVSSNGFVGWKSMLDDNNTGLTGMMFSNDRLVVQAFGGVDEWGMVFGNIFHLDKTYGTVSPEACEIFGSPSITTSDYPSFVEDTPVSASHVDVEYAMTYRLLESDVTPLEIEVCQVTTLPVELVSFSAKAVENRVEIEWVTASERNNDYFTIERSKDGIDFEEVARVDGAGNSTSTLYYQSVDFNPYQGTSYYRLKQTDFDGQTKTFEAVSVNIQDLDMLVWPNPASSNDRINCSGNFEVFDMSGREMAKATNSIVLSVGSYIFRQGDKVSKVLVNP